VTVAAALSIPVSTASGPFPDRELLIFLGYVTVFGTLVPVALALPLLLKALGLAKPEKVRRQGIEARLRVAHAALERAEELGRKAEIPEEALRRARGQLVLAGAIALAAALLGGHAAARRLVSPIERLKSAAARIGAGDLTVRLEIDRRDEIGDVARAFDEMGAALRATLGDVGQAADRLETTRIATFDERPFRALRPLSGGSFTLLPLDR